MALGSGVWSSSCCAFERVRRLVTARRLIDVNVVKHSKEIGPDILDVGREVRASERARQTFLDEIVRIAAAR